MFISYDVKLNANSFAVINTASITLIDTDFTETGILNSYDKLYWTEFIRIYTSREYSYEYIGKAMCQAALSSQKNGYHLESVVRFQNKCIEQFLYGNGDSIQAIIKTRDATLEKAKLIA